MSAAAKALAALKNEKNMNSHGNCLKTTSIHIFPVCHKTPMYNLLPIAVMQQFLDLFMSGEHLMGRI